MVIKKSILVDMWSLLCKGVEIMKHGRSGRPKQRFLYCDLDMTKLFWRANRFMNGGQAVIPGAGTRHSMDSSVELTANSLAFAKPPRPHVMKASSFMDEASETTSNYGSVNGNAAASGGGTWSQPHSQAPTAKKISNFFDLKKRDSERELFFRDILKVCDDMSTDVMRRASTKSYLTTDHKANISIIVADRTLDFEIDKVSRSHGFHR
jgi:hypothetical protein